MNISSLHIYPVKSMRGINIRFAEVKQRGLRGDRRWMLVDGNGRFITQRETPKLAQIKVKINDQGIKLTLPNKAPVEVPKPDENTRLSTVVWRSTVDAAHSQTEFNDAVSEFIGRPASLVFMDDEAERFANDKYTDEAAPVSFADGYPILITNTASLRALNKHIVANGGEEVPMSRFRPNIVIDGDEAWDEDRWKQLKIGDVVLDLVKPCTRCVTTTIDQITGAKQGREPLRTLKARRLSKDPEIDGVLFGWNAVPRTLGRIGVNDDVAITNG